MTNKPLIGVLPLYDTQKQSIWMLPQYMDSIEQEGGIPIILPYTANKEVLEEVCSRCSGFVCTGGQDVSPALYRELKKECCGETLDVLDSLTLTVFEYAKRYDLPLLGICRGFQIMNVFFGGTLYQDIKNQTDSKVNHHQEKPYHNAAHTVTLQPGQYLSKLLNKDTLEVNSIHHQAVRELGEGLSVLAVSEDGLIEAVKADSCKYMLGVQWHPEYSYKSDDSAKAIIRSFVLSAKLH